MLKEVIEILRLRLLQILYEIMTTYFQLNAAISEFGTILKYTLLFFTT